MHEMTVRTPLRARRFDAFAEKRDEYVQVETDLGESRHSAVAAGQGLVHCQRWHRYWRWDHPDNSNRCCSGLI